jgi:hypothetical protein
MKHDKHTTLHQIFCRLCFHAGLIPEQHEDRRERFISGLFCYPEDLICAAYHYILYHAKQPSLPSEDDFIRFMTPEFARRKKEMECA